MGIFDIFKKKTNNEVLSKKNDLNDQSIKEKNEELDLLELIKDENIPAIKDQMNHVIFARDYNNRRIILSFFAYQKLNNDGQLEECIECLKDNNRIDYITLFDLNRNKNFMINLYINKMNTYLVPMNYVNDEDGTFDDNIHYTFSALKAEEKVSANSIKGNDVTEGKEMRFASVKNPTNGEEFLPLFKTLDELRGIFNKEKYRICKMTYEEAVVYGKEFSGIVFRPTVESFIMKNSETRLFSSIDEFIKPYIDYKSFTKNEKTIQDKIIKFSSLERGTDYYNRYYRGILQDIKELDNIYLILSPSEFDKDTGESVPLASTKDGDPAIYIFSSIDSANKWVEHYNYYTPDGSPLIGKINNEKNFDSLFAIASKIGINLCIIDEGESLLGFSTNLFLDVNKLDTQIILRINKEEADDFLENKKDTANVKFNNVKVLGMMKNKDVKEYYELKLK